jgi:hypothetical protein
MDSRCLLTPPVILRELERLSGVREGSTRLHSSYDISKDDFWLLWQVNNRYIRLGALSASDMRLSLDDFSTKHCAPAVKTMREGMDE